ncbi:hypothetical protein CLV63_111164 [Murinocardiopsis flavida]|uniref:Uncharacterized protein n=1 Tax=Murinocardiopsis flavida TaxID=645275 RepID=A0A2P8DHB2_9ACTN|nr:hypothetical protein CLV63_111164 [Murinocardiopsis flavida]
MGPRWSGPAPSQHSPPGRWPAIPPRARLTQRFPLRRAAGPQSCREHASPQHSPPRVHRRDGRRAGRVCGRMKRVRGQAGRVVAVRGRVAALGGGSRAPSATGGDGRAARRLRSSDRRHTSRSGPARQAPRQPPRDARTRPRAPAQRKARLRAQSSTRGGGLAAYVRYGGVFRGGGVLIRVPRQDHVHHADEQSGETACTCLDCGVVSGFRGGCGPAGWRGDHPDVIRVLSGLSLPSRSHHVRRLGWWSATSESLTCPFVRVSAPRRPNPRARTQRWPIARTPAHHRPSLPPPTPAPAHPIRSDRARPLAAVGAASDHRSPAGGPAGRPPSGRADPRIRFDTAEAPAPRRCWRCL